MTSLLFFTKAGHPFSAQASTFLCAHYDTEVVSAKKGTSMPKAFNENRYDYIISFLCPWIIPQDILKMAATAAINFHPAPPEYPGTGCTNFALYDEVDEYGVTCHHMLPGVDSGDIIAVKRFPVYPADSVLTLTQRSYAYLGQLAYEIFDIILAGAPLPTSNEQWTRKPYTRNQLDDLSNLSPEMGEKELARRIRATKYPGFPAPRMTVAGHTFLVEDWNKTGDNA